MKGFFNLSLAAFFLIVSFTRCKTAKENKITDAIPPEILKVCIDTNFLYEESWEYTKRVGREPLRDSADVDDYYLNRLQVYKGIEIYQGHKLEEEDPERIALLDSLLKLEGLRYNDSMLVMHTYDLSGKTKTGFISMTDTLRELGTINADSAIFCFYNFYNIIRPQPNRAYFYYEFNVGPRYASGRIVILKKEEKTGVWKVEKKIMVWIS